MEYLIRSLISTPCRVLLKISFLSQAQEKLLRKLFPIGHYPWRNKILAARKIFTITILRKIPRENFSDREIDSVGFYAVSAIFETFPRKKVNKNKIPFKTTI